jgi:biopolymer transport protein ExbD
MAKLRMKKNGIERLNIIPIMDAVFIFIFYLLMSAQFVDIHEIETKVPKSEVADKAPKETLQLKVLLKTNKIEVYRGLQEKLVQSFAFQEGSPVPKEFIDLVNQLKKENPQENTAILSMGLDSKYESMVLVMEVLKGPKSQNFASVVLGE